MTTTFTPETLRQGAVIADKIEDGTLFRSRICRRAEHAETVRAVIRELQRLEAARLTLIDQQGRLSLRNVELQAESERLRGQVGRFQGVPMALIEAINSATGSNDWQGDFSPAELLEPACRAIASLAAGSKPLMDGEIIAAQESLRAQQDALYRSRIGLPCSKCQTGKYRADGNGYYDFHRCDSCMHVPIWGADGKEFGVESLIASSEVVADDPVRVTRLLLTDEGRAALTSTATGPLPGTNR